MRADRCVCGRRAVRAVRVPGRTTRYRNLGALAIPADCAIATCARCGTQYLPETLDECLAPVYQAELRSRAALAIAQLSGRISQRKLELLLGLSQGYLSRLKSGRGNPSASLISLLYLLGNSPGLLQQLEHYWLLPLKLSLDLRRPQ